MTGRRVRADVGVRIRNEHINVLHVLGPLRRENQAAPLSLHVFETGRAASAHEARIPIRSSERIRRRNWRSTGSSSSRCATASATTTAATRGLRKIIEIESDFLRLDLHEVIEGRG